MAKIRKRPVLARAGVGAVAVSTAALGLGLAATGASAHPSTPQQASGTVNFALPTSFAPTYIFPMVSGSFFGTNNQQYFQWLMYRPLYWFATGDQVKLNVSQSLAQAPVYSKGNTVATVTLKSWKWSNGDPITAQDVMFWINMQKAVDGIGGYGGYVPGTFPDDVTNVTSSGSTLTFDIAGKVNPTWFTYNALSEITPMPLQWDVTSASGAPGSGGCSKASFTSVTSVASGKSKGQPQSASAKACVAVYDYLSTQSGYNPVNQSKVGTASANWPASPLWSIVDGPWKLQSYSETANIVFVPNTAYSGSPKPKIAQFVEQNYTSDQAEFAALLAGNVQYGYIPNGELRSPAISPTKPGPNFPALASSFTLAPWTQWETQYWVPNENANGVAGMELRQAYIRQALQSMIDQRLILQHIYKGYGVVNDGPVPNYPPTPYSKAQAHNPWPYSPSTAKSLLTSHGWTIHAGGTDVCTASAGCGAGIPQGSKLSFNGLAQSGPTPFNEMLVSEVESWGSMGIHVAPKQETFQALIGAVGAACQHNTPACTWDFGMYGGWLYSPDYYPTGEDIFETGAISDNGSYSSPTEDSLIKATNTGNSAAAFNQYVAYTAKQVPVLWQPGADYQLSEVKNTLKGVLPQNPLGDITPETWSISG